MNVKKRFIAVLMTWNAWDKFSDEDIAYKVKDYIGQPGALHLEEVTVWNEEDEGQITIQYPLANDGKETPT